MNTLKIAVLSAALFFGSTAHAQQKYILGTSADFMGGGSNQIGSGFGSTPVNSGIAPYYGVYPSATLSSIGEHSKLDLKYNFVAQRHEMEPAVTTFSHAFGADLASQIGKRVRLRLSNTFDTAPNYSTLNVLKGFTFTPSGFQYVFEPQLLERSMIRDSANLNLETDLSEKAFLTFGASGSYLHYEDAPAGGTSLNDQVRVEGNFGYSRRRSGHQTWSLKYRVYQNDYEDYYNYRSHNATLGLEQQVKPTVRIILEGGGSFTEKTAAMDPYFGFAAVASIEKKIRANRLSAHYSHRSGDSSGLGYVSDIDDGGLAFAIALGRAGSLRLDAAAFRQQQHGNTGGSDYWGVRGSAALSRTLGKYWVMSIGASYQEYVGRTGTYQNYSYQQYYASVGYRFPELFRTEK